MIKLDIKDYCQNCPEFEAKTNKAVGRTLGGDTNYVHIVVSCENKDRCAAMHDYLKTFISSENT